MSHSCTKALEPTAGCASALDTGARAISGFETCWSRRAYCFTLGLRVLIRDLVYMPAASMPRISSTPLLVKLGKSSDTSS